LLQTEVLQLTGIVDGPARGAVVEAHLDKGRGPVATVMVQEGTLRIGEYIVAGTTYGKTRSMTDHNGMRVETAGPSTPVEVIGLADVPMAGDNVLVVADEKTAKEVAELRAEALRKSTVVKSSAATLEELLGRIRTQDTLEVPVIVKADMQGSVEAICESIGKLATDKVMSRIVLKGVGGITESDIMLATTTGAVIIGFNVRAGRGLDDLAAKQGVAIKYFSVIYEIVDAVKALMAGKLPPIQKEVVLGHAEVRNPISIPKVGVIAGSSVMDGKITRSSQLRLIRNDVVIYSGKIGSLRRFKDDVREVMMGYECGIGIDGYQDLRPGDVIEAFIIEEIAPTL
jgi:translation initiation factor IF-2